MFSCKRMYCRNNTTFTLHKIPTQLLVPTLLVANISRSYKSPAVFIRDESDHCVFFMINNDDAAAAADDDDDNNNNNNNLRLGFRSNKTCFSRLWRYLRHFHCCLGLPKSRDSLGWYWKAYTGRLCCSILATFIFHLVGALEKLRKESMSVVMSVRVQQLGCHWMDFHEIWNLSIFRKSVDKLQLSSNSDKNNRYFKYRPMYIFYQISLNSHWNEKCFRQKL